MRSTLAVDRMSIRQLFDRARVLIDRASPLRNQGPQDLDLCLQQLEAVLNEIELRGDQLTFVPPVPRAGQEATS
jgi:hypothetical protein